MKEINKISAQKFEEAVNANVNNIVHGEFWGMEIEMRYTLSLPEVLEFVNELVETCFLDDGEFVPEIMDFTLKNNVLTRYANFELPMDLNKQYELIYLSGVAEYVMSKINQIQLREIVEAAKKKINFKCQNDIAGVRAQLAELTEYFENIGTQMEQMMSGVSGEDIEKLAQAMADGALSEEKIVSAYIDAVKKDAAN